jgi:hypothetical protein
MKGISVLVMVMPGLFISSLALASRCFHCVLSTVLTTLKLNVLATVAQSPIALNDAVSGVSGWHCHENVSISPIGINERCNVAWFRGRGFGLKVPDWHWSDCPGPFSKEFVWRAQSRDLRDRCQAGRWSRAGRSDDSRGVEGARHLARVVTARYNRN